MRWEIYPHLAIRLGVHLLTSVSKKVSESAKRQRINRVSRKREEEKKAVGMIAQVNPKRKTARRRKPRKKVKRKPPIKRKKVEPASIATATAKKGLMRKGAAKVAKQGVGGISGYSAAWGAASGSEIYQERYNWTSLEKKTVGKAVSIGTAAVGSLMTAFLMRQTLNAGISSALGSAFYFFLRFYKRGGWLPNGEVVEGEHVTEGEVGEIVLPMLFVKDVLHIGGVVLLTRAEFLAHIDKLKRQYDLDNILIDYKSDPRDPYVMAQEVLEALEEEKFRVKKPM